MKRQQELPSLSEVNASVDVSGEVKSRRRLLAFLGPAYLVSVGYMDPGNWATDLAGGSQYGYTLIWVLLMSNVIALLLQSLSARLGIVRRKDLAQASREMYPPVVNGSLYVLAEIAIAATDLAEVLGMAIGLQLLTGMPLMWGVVISVLDTFLLLFLLNFGIRKMEAFIISLVGIIGMCFVAQMIFVKPEIGEIATGFFPSIPDENALYIAIGIIGATVMPHNLYLHSSLVQTRKFSPTITEIRRAIKYNIIDSAIALNMAFFVNAAILILAATAFYKNGYFEVAEIQDAHRLLAPLLGTEWAPVLFAIALIAAGQSSTITGTLAGQVVMEGYLNLRIRPWIRRLITRVIAIVPALLTIQIMGEHATGKLLVLSQVILSLQLGFAIIPLIHFVSDRAKMGEFAIGPVVKTLAWISAAVIVTLNGRLVAGQIQSWMQDPEVNQNIIYFLVIPIALYALCLLFYTTLMPLFRKSDGADTVSVPATSQQSLFDTAVTKGYQKIAIAVDFSPSDISAIRKATSLGGTSAGYLLIHVLESPASRVFGEDAADHETSSDLAGLENYRSQFESEGYTVFIALPVGDPAAGISDAAIKFGAELMVMGAHGHKGFKDVVFGTTINKVRHRLKIPVMIVR